MKPYLPAFFVWISLALILASCQAVKISMSGPEASVSSGKTIYRTTVVYHGREMPGMVMLKPGSDGTTRIAFYNDFGMTYVEGTMAGNTFSTENIIPVLDHPYFIREFEKAIRNINPSN